MIANARKRIHISSLYIGETETKLVAALSDALAKNGELELVIQVDALRSTRPSKAQISPVHLLLPLIGAYPDRVKVHLFRSPKLNGLLRHLVPRRFDEGWGTWHAKVYLVDDEVLLSGANLSTSYFTDRQDRYVHIKSASPFTSYLVELLRVFSEYSWRLRPTPDISLGYALDWFRRDSSIFNFANLARKDVARLQESTRAKTSLVHPAERAVIFPMVQSGVLGIREEEQSLAQLFDLIESGGPFHGTLVDLTSGYFALYGPYQDRVIGSNADYRIVAASPQANGFLGSKGLSGRIPAGYTLLERRFWNRVLAAHRQWENGKGIELSEWECPGWTYHAKGIWYSSSVFEAPYATLFGSTNLNSRSAHLDTEISFLLSVPERENSLRAALRHEYSAPNLCPPATTMRESGNATNLFGVPPPQGGTTGRQCVVKTNMFQIRYPRDSKWNHYDVVIEIDGKPTDFPPPRNREIIDELQVQEATTFRPRGVYDGRKNLFSIVQYGFHPAGEFTVGRPNPNATRPARRMVVKLKAAGLIHMNTLNALMAGRVGIDQADATQIAVTALNYVIRMAPVTNSNYPLKGASFFMDIPNVSKNLAKGLTLYRGFFQSVRPAVDRMLVNIDVATGVVYQPLTVLDFAMAHLGLRDARQVAELSETQLISLTRVLKGVHVVPTAGRPPRSGGHRPKSVKNIDKRSAASFMFDRNGTQISVQQHMQEQHNYHIHNPRAPCVIVNRDAAYPMEFLKILPHQLLKRPVPPDLTSEVLNFSTQKPDDRLRQITQGFQQLQYSQSDYLNGADVKVDSQPMGVPARVLAPPDIGFGGNQVMQVRDGTWNMLRKQMFSVRRLACWGVVIFDPRFNQQHAYELASRLVKVMEERGIKVLDHRPVIESGSSQIHDIPGLLTNVANKALQQGQVIADQQGIKDRLSTQLIVCVLPFPATEIRTAIKRWGDCQAGIPTQCVVGKKFSDQLTKGRDDQYLNNLVL
ncbi:CDP-diacylglycerol--glycerol-3-phosphate 3-phosphatidyltransferase, partial [Ceratobasidium sp. UAMH 11750]